MSKAEELYRRERQSLLGYIRSRVSSREDAEDILQDVFFQAVRSISVTEPIDNLLGWLYTAARNRIVDWYRSKRTVPLHDEDIDLSLEDLLRDNGISVEQAFIRGVVMEALMDALEDLPAEQREVFICQAVEGQTFRDIAAKTGVPLNTLLSRKRYAVIALRRRLEEIKELIHEMNQGGVKS